jgi:hypothetical protein
MIPTHPAKTHPPSHDQSRAALCTRQPANHQSAGFELAAIACDAVVRRLCLGLWRFMGIKSENATPLKRELPISNERLN